MDKNEAESAPASKPTASKPSPSKPAAPSAAPENATPDSTAPAPVRREVGSPAELPDDARVFELSLGQIKVNPRQPRQSFDDAALSELADSIKANGLIQPIVVRRKADGFELIAGERRYRATELAGLDTIRSLVREADPTTQARLALVENIHRADLNPIERAEAYQALMDEADLTQAALAEELGEDRSSIANHLRLLKLTESVRTLVVEERITLGHAKVLAGVDDGMEQDRLAKAVVAQNLSVRNLERLVAEDPKQATRKPTGREAHLSDLEEKIRQSTGLRAQVASRKGGKGRLTLHYGSLDEFDDLLAKLGVRLED